jgi:hypothetical protein
LKRESRKSNTFTFGIEIPKVKDESSKEGRGPGQVLKSRDFVLYPSLTTLSYALLRQSVDGFAVKALFEDSSSSEIPKVRSEILKVTRTTSLKRNLR